MSNVQVASPAPTQSKVILLGVVTVKSRFGFGTIYSLVHLLHSSPTTLKDSLLKSKFTGISVFSVTIIPLF